MTALWECCTERTACTYLAKCTIVANFVDPRSRSMAINKLPHDLNPRLRFLINRRPPHPPPTVTTQLLPARPPRLLRPFHHSLHTNPPTNPRKILLFSLPGAHRRRNRWIPSHEFIKRCILMFRLAEFIPAATTGADAVRVSGFIVDQESAGDGARGRVGECLFELDGSCFGGPVESIGSLDTDAGWGVSRKDSRFVMWKPTGEVDAYGGSAGLEAAMIGDLVLVVGVSVISDREVILLYRVTHSQRRASKVAPTSRISGTEG